MESNKLLARLAVQQNFQQGLPEWLRQLKLSKYTEALSKWCHEHHVTSPEDLSALALAAAVAVEPDLRLRQIVEQILSLLESLVFHYVSLQLTFGVLRCFAFLNQNMLFLFFLHFFNIFKISLFCFIFRLRLFTFLRCQGCPLSIRFMWPQRNFSFLSMAQFKPISKLDSESDCGIGKL